MESGEEGKVRDERDYGEKPDVNKELWGSSAQPNSSLLHKQCDGERFGSSG